MNQISLATLMLTMLRSGGVAALPSQTSLVRWYEADYGTYSDTGLTTPQTTDTGAVKGWADRTGNANATEGTNNPKLQLSGINGKASILFDSAVATAPRLAFTSLVLTDFTIFIVADPTTTDHIDASYVLSGSGRGVFVGGSALSGWGEFDSSNLRQTDSKPTNAGIYVAQRTALYRNGVVPTYFGTPGNLTGLTLTTIGTRADSVTFRFNGLISAILIYNATLAAAALNTTGGYLATKYGITWTTIT